MGCAQCLGCSFTNCVIMVDDNKYCKYDAHVSAKVCHNFCQAAFKSIILDFLETKPLHLLQRESRSMSFMITTDLRHCRCPIARESRANERDSRSSIRLIPSILDVTIWLHPSTRSVHISEIIAIHRHKRTLFNELEASFILSE